MSLRRVALSLGATAAAAGLAGCSSQRLLWPQQRATCARAAMSDTAVHRPEWRRFAVEMGTGTSLRRQDHTAAAVRALEDALWRVSMTAYRALDKRPEEMKIEVVVGVPKPAAVDESAVLAVLPYGERSIRVVEGGLAIPGGCGADAQGDIIMANAAAIVYLDVGDYLALKRSASMD
mmetsp:Transcript_28378/g.91015  ORF Transcript_28378/g.91015 Transcript_28378/m.91015 type:complete len:177 (+) Transcript_28378:19-549(+)